MSKYRVYVTVKQYRSFEFEADDDELAFDHIEQLTWDNGPSYVLSQWDESGPDDIWIDEIEELT